MFAVLTADEKVPGLQNPPLVLRMTVTYLGSGGNYGFVYKSRRIGVHQQKKLFLDYCAGAVRHQITASS